MQVVPRDGGAGDEGSARTGTNADGQGCPNLPGDGRHDSTMPEVRTPLYNRSAWHDAEVLRETGVRYTMGHEGGQTWMTA